MEHSFQPIDILNEHGEVIGSKPRHKVDKNIDVYHAVYVWLITPEKQMVLTSIPAREDLPNLYTSQYGLPMATIRRTDETAEHALRRGVSRELFIDDISPILLGEELFTLEDDRRVLATSFYIHSEVPTTYSTIDVGPLTLMSRAKFEAMLDVRPERAAPTLRAIWSAYKERLPV